MKAVGPLKEECTHCELWQEIIRWIGTPFRYGGRTPGRGADCSTFPLLVFERIGRIKPGWWRTLYDLERIRQWRRGEVDLEWFKNKLREIGKIVEKADRCGDVEIVFNPATGRFHTRICLYKWEVVEAVPDIGVTLGGWEERNDAIVLRILEGGCERWL